MRHCFWDQNADTISSYYIILGEYMRQLLSLISVFRVTNSIQLIQVHS